MIKKSAMKQIENGMKLQNNIWSFGYSLHTHRHVLEPNLYLAASSSREDYLFPIITIEYYCIGHTCEGEKFC